MNLIANIAVGSLTLIGLLALALAIGVDIGRRQANRYSPRASRRDVRRWQQAYLKLSAGRPVHSISLRPHCRCATTPADPQRPPVTAAGLSER